MDEVSDTSTIVVKTVNERALGVQGDRAEFIRDKVTPISTGMAGSVGEKTMMVVVEKVEVSPSVGDNAVKSNGVRDDANVGSGNEDAEVGTVLVLDMVVTNTSMVDNYRVEVVGMQGEMTNSEEIFYDLTAGQVYTFEEECNLQHSNYTL